MVSGSNRQNRKSCHFKRARFDEVVTNWSLSFEMLSWGIKNKTSQTNCFPALKYIKTWQKFRKKNGSTLSTQIHHNTIRTSQIISTITIELFFSSALIKVDTHRNNWTSTKYIAKQGFRWSWYDWQNLRMTPMLWLAWGKGSLWLI